MDGIAGITARIAQIQALVVPVRTGATTAPATSSASASTFATALADEVAKTTAAPAAASTGKLNADGVPVELASYGNGQIPESALQKVGGTGAKLWAPAAQKLEQLMAAAAKDGVQIGITDSYRSYAEQVDIAQRKGLYSRGGLAAQPGTSEHGWGLAADLDLNGKALSWMRANGDKYGFDENVPRENWHWAYQPKAG